MNIKKVLSLAIALTIALIVIPAFGLPAAATEDGLIAHYTLNGNANDSAGTNDGTVNGTGLVFDPNGFAAFPGGTTKNGTYSGTAYISLPNELVKQLTGDYTVSMWVKQNSKYNMDGKAVAFWDIANGTTNRMLLQMTGKLMTVQYRPDRNRIYYEYKDLDATKDKWALVTATFDLTNQKKATVYINGEPLTNGIRGKDSATDQEFDTSTAPSTLTGATILLGHNVWNNGDNPELQGSMADVRIYNKALTADEVKALLSTKKTLTVSYMAGEVELQKQVVEYFSDEASFTVPETVIYDGIPYNLVGETNRTATGDTAEVEYEKTTAKATDIKPVAGVTYIEGNEDPLPKKVTLGTDQDGVTLDVDVTWDKTPLETANYGEPVTITGTLDSEYASLGKPEVSVTKLRCDDALVDEIKTGGHGTNAAHSFATPVKGRISFEFDLTYNIDGIVGDNGVFIGYFDGTTVPRFGNSGNAIGIQGMKSPDQGNIGLRDGGASVKTFAPVKGETYRIFITTNTAANPAEATEGDDSGTYTLIARDSTGKLVYKTEKNLAYRISDGKRACGEILNALVVTNNNGNIKELNQFVDDIVVKNFRIAWAEGYTEYTVKAQCDGKDIEGFKSYTKKFLDKAAAEKAAVPAINNYAVSGAPVVDDEAKTVTFSYISVKTADVFGYTFLSNKLGVEGSDGYACGPLGWESPTGKNVVFVTFDAPAVENGKVLASAALNVYFPRVNNTASNETYNINVYKIDPSKVDANGLVADEYTVDNWKEKLGAVRIGGATDSHPSANKFNSYIIDLHECTGEKIVLAIDFSREIYMAGASYANGAYKPYIIDEKIVTPPEVPALTAALGWNEGAFTIDYTASDVTAVENAVYGATVVSSDGKTFSGTFEPGKDGGIGLTTPNTNLTYVATPTVKFEGAVFKGEPTGKEAIYSLVMTALEKAIVDKTIEGQINAEQLDAVNTVLANGGIFVDEKGNLTAEAQKVMTKTDKTITLKPEAVALGLKFSVDENAMTYAVKDGEDNITTPADAITVTEDTITINDAASAEAVMLALEAVNLEFVPTEMADADAEDADAAQDFIPEL